jgi:hypothetical protein
MFLTYTAVLLKCSEDTTFYPTLFCLVWMDECLDFNGKMIPIIWQLTVYSLLKLTV